MRWHLVTPLGVSERTTEADSLFWAKRRFAPIPKHWAVVSDASYVIPCRVPDAPSDLCSKCLRNTASAGYAKCDACRKGKREGEARRAGLRGKNAKSSTRAESMRQYYAEQTPEQKAARAERLRLAAIAHQERRNARRRAAEKAILRGIEQRRAGQTAAAKRERKRPSDREYRRRIAESKQLTLGV